MGGKLEATFRLQTKTRLQRLSGWFGVFVFHTAVSMFSPISSFFAGVCVCVCVCARANRMNFKCKQRSHNQFHMNSFCFVPVWNIRGHEPMGQNVDIPVSSVFCGFVCHSNVCHQFKLNQALYTETKGLTTRVRKFLFVFHIWSIIVLDSFEILSV